MFEVFQSLATKKQKAIDDKIARSKSLMEKMARTPDKVSEAEAEELLAAYGNEQTVIGTANALARYFQIQTAPAEYATASKAQADAHAAMKAHIVETMRLQDELTAKRGAIQNALADKETIAVRAAFTVRDKMAEYEDLRATLANHLGPYVPVLPSDTNAIAHEQAKPKPGDSPELLAARSDLNESQRLINYLNTAGLIDSDQGQAAKAAKKTAGAEVQRIEGEAQKAKAFAMPKPMQPDGKIPPNGPNGMETKSNWNPDVTNILVAG